MSKRKGQRRPINSDIQSVLRAPDELAAPDEASGEEAAPVESAAFVSEPEASEPETSNALGDVDGFGEADTPPEETPEQEELPRLVPEDMDLGANAGLLKSLDRVGNV